MDWSNEVCCLTDVLRMPHEDYRESERQVKEWLGRSMVETEQQMHTGIESGALKEDGYIRVDKLMSRICVPKPGELQDHSIILWTKESADDKVKTWDKVICPTSDSNPTQSENLCLYIYSSEVWSMVWTNWTASFRSRMLQLKKKCGLCKLILSMPSSTINQFR